MPFNRPTLKTITNRVLSSIRLYSGVDAFLRFSLAYAFGYAIAAVSHSLYGRILFLTYQLPHKAEGDYLLGWCGAYGIAPKGATKAAGKVTVTGTDGSAVAVGKELTRSDGVVYTVTTGGTVASGTLNIIVECNSYGLTGNSDVGQKLTFVNPPTGVNSEAVVHADTISGGLDVEDTESLRARLLDRIQYPPHGGNLHDYVQWALEKAGVTRAWSYSYPNAGADKGEVFVVFAMDDLYSDGIPSDSDVTALYNYIDENYRPACALLTVYKPTAVPVNLTIELHPNEVSIQEEVETALVDLFLSVEPGGTIRLSQIHEAISSSTGEQYHILTVPSANVVLTGFEIPVLGTITWTTP